MVGVVQHESGLCKNLLQEFAQKHGYPLPQYKSVRQGEEHSLVFSSTVEIAGVSYSGGCAKSKKEAEIKAARTALLAIQATQPGIVITFDWIVQLLYLMFTQPLPRTNLL